MPLDRGSLILGRSCAEWVRTRAGLKVSAGQRCTKPQVTSILKTVRTVRPFERHNTEMLVRVPVVSDEALAHHLSTSVLTPVPD